MMKMIKQCTLLLSLVLVTMTTQAAQEGIEVIGKANIKALPDQFSLTISIKERGRVASKVKSLVDHKSQQVVDMFKRQGVNEKHIDTSMVTMYPFYEKVAVKMPHKVKSKLDEETKVVTTLDNTEQTVEKIRLFDVGRTISVKLSSLEQYDSVLDKLVKIGVSHISAIELGFSDPESLYENALNQAIDNASDKAKKMAKQLGVDIGQVISVKEVGYHAPVAYRMAAMESDVGFKSQATERAISAQVSVIYKIKP